MSPREQKARAMLAEHGCVEGFNRPLELGVGRRVIVDPNAIVNAMLDFAQQEVHEARDIAATTHGSMPSGQVPDCSRCGRPSPQGDRCYACLKGEVQQLLVEAERDAIRLAKDDWWLPVAEAPYDTPLLVRVGGMTFGAMLKPDAGMTSDEELVDQWVATVEGEHPPCWSGGACWSSNEDGWPSSPPDAWRAA